GVADKKRLYTKMAPARVNEASEPVYNEVLKPQDSGNAGADLRKLPRRHPAGVMQPRLLQLRRLVIGEASRFPDLARRFYERGPERTVAALATTFKRLAKRGALQLGDPQLAAAHFNWLIMSIPLNQAMLLGDDHLPSPKDLDRYADAGVRVFLAAYTPR